MDRHPDSLTEIPHVIVAENSEAKKILFNCTNTPEAI